MILRTARTFTKNTVLLWGSTKGNDHYCILVARPTSVDGEYERELGLGREGPAELPRERKGGCASGDEHIASRNYA